jgi:hypothetical protein
MNNFDYLIGKTCTYIQEIDCEIQSFEYRTEDKWPYTACVLVKLLPLNLEDVDSETLEDMQDKVGLENISNIEQ